MTQQEFFSRYSYSPSRDRIGGGGFGTVYKAKDNVLHREVAIKVSEVKTTADGKKTFSLKDEFEALNHVPKHPNIANYEAFYSYESPQGLFDYAVMQYYPDGNLGNAIRQGLTAEQKEDIATQLLEGIAFLHQHKVVHRDLKPGNILIVRDGNRVIPLITDFGLSKAAGVVDGSVFSNSFGAGTPRYSSPEQLQGNPLRFNTDLWSYGAILYELFTGEQLFSAGSGAANTAQADMEIYNKIVNGNVQSLGKMPETWRKVTERCLVVDATKRAKDAGELFAIIKGDEDETEITEGPSDPGRRPPLQRGAGGIPKTPAGSASPKTPHSEPAPLSPTPTDKPTNKKALWIGLVVAAVVALLLLVLWPKGEPTPTDPDTQAYEACQTVADYRAYISDYGSNSSHYADAKAFVERYESDSIEQARQAQAMADAAQKEEAERQAQAKAEKKEDDAYRKCTTIAGCEAYLKKYPDGRYVAEVETKLEQIKKEQKEQQETENRPKPLIETTNHLPTGSPVCIYYFSADKYNINSRESMNKEADSALSECLNSGHTGFRLIAWALPGEEYELASNRGIAAERQIRKLTRNHCDIQSNVYECDWEKVITLISQSGLKDKEAIIYTIQKASDKEQAFKDMCSIYRQIESEILPMLRRVEVYAY